MSLHSRTARFLAMLALLGLAAVPALGCEQHCDNSRTVNMIENYVAQIVTGNLNEIYGDALALCHENGDIALCIDPDTPPERVAEILALLPQPDGDRYNLTGRWTITASGSYPYYGEPIVLSYSIIPDGTYIPPGSGDPGSASDLQAVLTSQFGSETQWRQIFADCFADWASHIGITYILEDDDGAAFPNSIGILGTRGDVRIGGHYIDGTGGVLGYNRFPASGGDMVLDTTENWGNSANDYRFLRNVTMHEHGHGIGLLHTEPINGTKLMEAYLNTGFLGPRDDDIRGGSRMYGDPFEPDDTFALAQDLGTFDGQITLEDRSLNYGADVDFYEFTPQADFEITLYLQAVGSYYILDGAPIYTNQIMDLGFALYDEDENLILAQNDAPIGQMEILTDYALDVGTYYLKIEPHSGNDVQRYRIVMDIELTDLTAVDETIAPVTGLDLSAFPNPFNPKTTVSFYAPQAGSISLGVYNVQGRLVRDFEYEADLGWQHVTWNGLDQNGQQVPSGLYFIRVQAAGLSETVRGVLLK